MPQHTQHGNHLAFVMERVRYDEKQEFTKPRFWTLRRGIQLPFPQAIQIYLHVATNTQPFVASSAVIVAQPSCSQPSNSLSCK